MAALTGRAAIVTGAGQGIGRAIATELHARGARVYLLDINAQLAHDAAASLGERATALVADVRDRTQMEAAHEQAERDSGAVDILVNNAARTVSRSVWEIDAEEWDDVLAINLRGVLTASQIAGAGMRQRGSGRIINLTSLAGQQGGLVAGAHYAASKAGIIVLTKIFARELAPFGVTVNAVAPAAIDGPVLQTLGAERIRAVADSIPVGRIGRPNEVAAAVAYLASDDAAFVTGATLDVNGGVFMR